LGIGVCDIAVLDIFSCGISVLDNCRFAVFSELTTCNFVAFQTVLKISRKSPNVLRAFFSFRWDIANETGEEKKKKFFKCVKKGKGLLIFR